MLSQVCATFETRCTQVTTYITNTFGHRYLNKENGTGDSSYRLLPQYTKDQIILHKILISQERMERKINAYHERVTKQKG